jgi:putative nucleotidyltransferase with HDIG domain
MDEKTNTGAALKKEVIDNFKKLYPMPHVMLKARKIIDDPRSDAGQLANVISAEPALAGRILKIANSAYYKRRGTVASIQQAVATLGTKTIGHITNMVSQSKMLGQNLKGYMIESGELWRHSLTVAVTCERLARKTGYQDMQEAFLAGLMHDTGKIILDHYILANQSENENILTSYRHNVPFAEDMILGFDHAEIGCELCIKWQLPVVMANAIRYHHMYGESFDNPLVYILQLSNLMAHRMKEILSGQSEALPLTHFSNALGVQFDDLSDLADEIVARTEDLEEDTV